MSDKDSAQHVIDAYRKRQHAASRAPIILGVAAVLLIAGAAALIFWLVGPDQSGNPISGLFATDTPTPTITSTPTNTATVTTTPTITATGTEAPSPTVSPTVAGPFEYQVKEGDSLFSIAQQFEVDLLLLETINNIDPASPNINVGQILIIPGPDTQMPTATLLPENIGRGAVIDYRIQVGDSLLSIALAFNTSVEEIKEENEIENENEIFVGQMIKVPVNTVPTNTPVPPTVTSTPPTPGVPTPRPLPTNTPTTTAPTAEPTTAPAPSATSGS